MLSGLYNLATRLGRPFVRLYMRRRLARGREDGTRLDERYGQPGRERPSGLLIWCHAASNGEAASLGLLIRRLKEAYPRASILLTTGTVSAARLMMPRLPPYAIHQYIPIDLPDAVARFLDHWRPDLALWIESELWPNMLAGIRRRRIPAVLLNARMSDGSFHRWRRARGWAREILSTFALCMAQTEDDRGRYVALGARKVRMPGNLKYAAEALPADTDALRELTKAIGARPVWLFASSHRGEEAMALAAHRAMLAARPDLLLVLVPRHAARGSEIAQLITGAGLRGARRSLAEPPADTTQVYLADTLGELGLFYRLSPIAAIGGSFVPVGGHNPVEAAQLDCAILFGPFMFKSAGLAKEFVHAKAAMQLRGGDELAAAIGRLLDTPHERMELALAARVLADARRQVVDRIVQDLAPFLPSSADHAA